MNQFSTSPQTPQLSNYIRFFQTVAELESEDIITRDEKQDLKVAFATKDSSLQTKLFLCQVNESDYRKAIQDYLRETNRDRVMHKLKRSRTTTQESSPNQSTREPGQRSTEEYLQKQIDSLSGSLMALQLSDTNEVNSNIQHKLIQLSRLLNQLVKPHTSKTLSYGTMDPILNSSSIKTELNGYNKLLKSNYKSYTRCLLPLMNDAVTHQQLHDVLKSVMSHLICCDNFTIIICRDQHLQLYQSVSDVSSIVPLNAQIEQELQLISDNRVTLLSKDFLYPTLSQLFNNLQYSRSFLVKVVGQLDMYFVFHQHDGREECINYHLLKFANEYRFVDDVIQLGWFLYDTVNQIKVNQFKPLQLANTIEDIGLCFLRCSKYLLIELMMGSLKQRFVITRSNSDTDAVCFEFKDVLPLKFYIQDILLTDPNDFALYKETCAVYNRYQRFIKENYERITFYKFFLRSRDQLLFEFDKKGILKFQSRPIPAAIKQEFKISLDTLTYDKMFASSRPLIANIENYLHTDMLRSRSKQFLNDQESDSPYEIFMCIEEQFFKGFVVIFQEDQSGWVKNQHIALRANNKALSTYLEEDMQKRLRKTRVQHEAINYINKLEQNNPDMRNSVVSMFMPSAATAKPSPLSFQRGPKIVVVEKQVQETTKPIQQVNKNLIFRKLELDHTQNSPAKPIPAILKHKNLGQMDIKMRLRMGSMSLDDFKELPLNDKLDSMDFNVLKIDNKLDKHRIVWAIFRKNNFFEEFKIQGEKFLDFITALEYRYNETNNPFHNYDHGVQVMQSVHALILLQAQTKDVLDYFTRFTLVFAALCHDVAHTGRTNMFEINSYSKLAVTYHDKSVLEQHHIATTVSILRDEKTNVLSQMPDQQFRVFRRKLTQHILYTDITEHFKLIKDFESSVNEKGSDFGVDDENDIKLVCAMLIHTADFNGVAKKYPESRQWSEKVNQEFMSQYKEEGKLGLPQQPYMKDLDKLGIMAKSEMSFIKVIVRPLYQMLSDFLDGLLQSSVDNLDESYASWEAIHKEHGDA